MMQSPHQLAVRAVYSDGSICLDILQDRWNPCHSVSTILTSIQSLLTGAPLLPAAADGALDCSADSSWCLQTPTARRQPTLRLPTSTTRTGVLPTLCAAYQLV